MPRTEDDDLALKQAYERLCEVLDSLDQHHSYIAAAHVASALDALRRDQGLALT